jgi:hypothetical protein
MNEYRVGYGKPPQHSQFKKGTCPNPRGRGKRHDQKFGQILKRTLNAKIEFQEHGKIKKASRIELSIRRLVASALKGHIASAAMLLKLRAHAQKHRDPGPIIIQINNSLPDPPEFDTD